MKSEKKKTLKTLVIILKLKSMEANLSKNESEKIKSESDIGIKN